MDEMHGKSVAVTPCGHCFHLACEKRLLRSACPTRASCPLCRKVVHNDDSRTDTSCLLYALVSSDVLLDEWLNASGNELDAILDAVLRDWPPGERRPTHRAS